MANILEKGNLFNEELVRELFDMVKGKSSIAALHAADPISFVGNKEFTFQMDKEVDIVAESGAKSTGGITLAPVTIVPVKFEYSARVTDEFMYASDEEQIDILTSFNEGFAKKLARGFDIAAMHGVNPRTGVASTVVGGNDFDEKITNILQGTDYTADEAVEAIIALIQDAENDITGMAMAPYLRSELAKLTTSAGKLYPDLAWGNAPSTINGLPVSVNPTVATYNNDIAIVGDFASAFKWGYAKDIMFDVIQYGNPDNDTEAGDLKGHNQVLLRAEAYIGWGILDPTSFAILQGTVKAQSSDGSDANTTKLSATAATSAKASK